MYAASIRKATGVYRILNSTNGRSYIGSAVDVRGRCRDHESNLFCLTHSNSKLQRAWNKYGPAAFTFSVLLVCEKHDLIFYEQRCIDGFNSVVVGYNIAPVAGNMLGFKHSEETKEKIRQVRIGAKATEKAKANMSEYQRGRSIESRAKASASNTGRKRSQETVEKIKEAWVLRRVLYPMTAETKAKISKAASASLTGRVVSSETRLKMSIAHKGRKNTPEQMAKWHAARKVKGN